MIEKQQRNKFQTGVTLVELLIAMGLSVFLMAAVIQSFLGSKQSTDVVQAQARMQENARFAMMFLTRSIRMAGFPSQLIPPDGLPDISIVDSNWRGDLMPANATFASFAQQAAVWGENNSSATMSNLKSNTDVVHIRLQGMGDGSVTDCQGRDIPIDAWAILSFYVDDADNFRCRSDDGAGTAGSVQDVALVQGIEELQIQYGLNAGVAAATDYDASQVIRYATADQIAAAEWQFVSNVKVGLLSASDSEPLSRAAPARVYTLLDQASASYQDGKARQQFAQTMRIRNLNWNAR
ncbi:MAG: PilW family protein [Pseudomonadales bacterium]